MRRILYTHGERRHPCRQDTPCSSVPRARSLSVFFCVFCGFALLSARAQDDVLARIGEAEVKLEDLRVHLDQLSPEQRAALARDPALLNQFVRSALVERMILTEALAKGWDKQPAVIAKIQRARVTAITESYLQSISQSPDGFPTDADLQKAYEANKASLQVPRQFRVAQIYIAAPKDGAKAVLESAQAKLDAVRRALLQPGADFAALAKANSEEAESAARGGEIGWLVESNIQPEIRAVLPKLKTGEPSDPIRMNDGWHIICILDRKDAYTPTLAEIRDQLAQRLRAAQAQANSQAYLAKLLEQNPVAINEIALSKVLQANPR